MSKISDITSQAIAKLESDPAILNLRIIIESQFDVWTTTLFPLLQAKKIPCYSFVANLLVQDGHPEATAEIVSNYFCRIREKRKAAAISSAPVVRSPARRSPVETRSAPSIAPVVKTRRVEIAAVPVDDWLPEKVRLQGEPDDAPWSGEDQWMWNQLLEFAKSVNRDVFKNIIDVEDKLDGTQKQVYKLLRNKYKSLFMQPA